MRYVSSLALACFVIACLAIPQQDLSAEGAPRVSQVCLDCHDGFDAGLGKTLHRLTDLDQPEARVACTDCHQGDVRHYEEDPEEFPMTNPAKATALAQAQLCASCHMNAHQQNILKRNVHMDNDVNCSSCHSVHGSTQASLLKEAQFSLCISCHTSLEGEFARPFRHPVNDEIVQCSECHMSLDATGTELSYNGSNVCKGCHAEMMGPFPFEHQATLDFSTQEGGCLNCHEAHGADLARMLKQPYEPPHYQICSQCHAVPLHNNNSMHGTTFSGVACNECHTDIHGSYVSRNFLSESLQGQGCFNGGCHQY